MPNCNGSINLFLIVLVFGAAVLPKQVHSWGLIDTIGTAVTGGVATVGAAGAITSQIAKSVGAVPWETSLSSSISEDLLFESSVDAIDM